VNLPLPTRIRSPKHGSHKAWNRVLIPVEALVLCTINNVCLNPCLPTQLARALALFSVEVYQISTSPRSDLRRIHHLGTHEVEIGWGCNTGYMLKNGGLNCWIWEAGNMDQVSR
jgi:hypothetical protein